MAYGIAPSKSKDGQHNIAYLNLTLNDKAIWAAGRSLTLFAQDKSGKYRMTELAKLFTEHGAEIAATITAASKAMQAKGILAEAEKAVPEQADAAKLLLSILKGK